MLSPGIADQVGSILQTVVKSGTATRAFVPGVTVAGKTGTTEGYGDAWFVGWTKEYTVAIWVGYPDRFKPMETEFQGDPVAGGTYPAGIFKTFVEALVGLKKVKKDTTETAPAVPPGSSAGGVSDAPSGARHGRRDRGRRRAAGVDAGAPAGGARRAGARAAGAGRAAPSSRAEPPPETPAEPPPETGRGRSPRPATGSAYAASFGRGRETLREPGTQKRHGRSAALVIPIRVPTTGSTSSQPGGGRLDRDRAAVEVGAVEVELDPERLRELARARAEVLDALEAAALAHQRRSPRAARARGSAPPRRRPRARRRR